MFPDDPATTYIADSVPAIKAADLNSIQKELGKISGASLGRLYYGWREEFDFPMAAYVNTAAVLISGRGMSLGDEASPSTGTLSNLKVKTNTYSAPDGIFGFLSLVQDGTGASAVGEIAGPYVPIGTREFKFGFRMKVKTKANLATHGGLIASLKLNGSGRSGLQPHEWPGFYAENGSANWIVGGATAVYDSGVAVSDDTYYSFEIVRVGTALSFWINGAQVHSETASGSINGTVAITLNGNVLTDNTEYAAVDNIYLGSVRP